MAATPLICLPPLLVIAGGGVAAGVSLRKLKITKPTVRADLRSLLPERRGNAHCRVERRGFDG
jgi:hypothetical protein